VISESVRDMTGTVVDFLCRLSFRRPEQNHDDV
jgi:hypothetical protein